jgi:serine protease Do
MSARTPGSPRAAWGEWGGRLAGVALLVALAGCNALDKKRPPPAGSNGLPPGAVPVQNDPPPKPPDVQPAPATTLGALPSLAPLVSKAGPSVVTVKSLIRKQNAFGRPIAEEHGVGTGFVYDAKGYLLTNNHVIDEASEIQVKFADGKEASATVVGKDKPTDVAVIKVDREDLAPLPLGDSRAVEAGDWVIAIGNPFGLEHTVSAGIVSAKGRTRDDVQGLDPTGYFNFIQTDASINPGNSGGPLLNMAGQVIGINSAVRANANNIGFAIPMEMVVQLLPMLLKDGKITRSAIGIVVDEVSTADVERINKGATGPAVAPGRRGAKVLKVIPGGAGEAAGLAAGDVILMFDGKPVKDPNELRWLASIGGVNKAVTIRVSRGERTFDMRITLGELSE